jgi:hypothetical protein
MEGAEIFFFIEKKSGLVKKILGALKKMAAWLA